MLAEDGVSSWANPTRHPLTGREERGVGLKMEANESRTGALLYHVGPHSNGGSVPLCPSLPFCTHLKKATIYINPILKVTLAR